MKKAIGVFLIVIGAVMGIGIASAIPSGNNSTETTVVIIIVSVVLIVLGALLLRRDASVDIRKLVRAEEKQRLLSTVSGNHVAGLPLLQGAQCNVQFCQWGIAIKSPGAAFDLPIVRITDISVDIQIVKETVHERWIKYFMLITYISAETDDIAYISIEIPNIEGEKARELAVSYRAALPNAQTKIVSL